MSECVRCKGHGAVKDGRPAHPAFGTTCPDCKGSGLAPKLTVCQRSNMRDDAVAKGREMARKVFSKRGNHSEAHLGEAELAATLAVAYEVGFEAGVPQPCLCPKCGALTHAPEGK